MYETSDNISSIVDDIRSVQFSKVEEIEKQIKRDKFREDFERVMLEEENQTDPITKKYA